MYLVYVKKSCFYVLTTLSKYDYSSLEVKLDPKTNLQTYIVKTKLLCVTII